MSDPADFEMLEWARTATPAERNGAVMRWPEDSELAEAIARRGLLSVCRAFGEAWDDMRHRLDAAGRELQPQWRSARAMLSCCGARGDGYGPLPERIAAAALALDCNADRLLASVADLEACGMPTCVAVVTAVAVRIKRQWDEQAQYGGGLPESYKLTRAQLEEIAADERECARLIARIDRELARQAAADAEKGAA